MSERQYISKKVRDRIKQKYGGHCAYCGCVPDKICIDHMIPVCDGQRVSLQFMAGYDERIKSVNDENNLMPSCFACNNYKLNMDLEMFRRELGKQADRALKMSVNARLAVKYGLFLQNNHPIVFFFEKWDNGWRPIQVIGSCEAREV